LSVPSDDFDKEVAEASRVPPVVRKENIDNSAYLKSEGEAPHPLKLNNFNDKTWTRPNTTCTFPSSKSKKAIKISMGISIDLSNYQAVKGKKLISGDNKDLVGQVTRAKSSAGVRNGGRFAISSKPIMIQET